LPWDPGKLDGHSYPLVNAAFQKIAGRSRLELGELGWGQVVHPQDAEREREQRRLLEEGKASSYSTELRLLRPDGSQVWVELTATPFAQVGQERRKAIYMIKDISDRKAVEERLSESERS